MAIRGIPPRRREGDKIGEVVELGYRGVDGYGSGFFGASRGKRKHNGIDYAAPELTRILSPVSGNVTKIGYPYTDDLSYKYVQITDNKGNDHRLFYVSPVVKLGNSITCDTIIGEVQNISKRYNEFLMVNHLHYEIKDENGKFIDPENS